MCMHSCAELALRIELWETGESSLGLYKQQPRQRPGARGTPHKRGSAQTGWPRLAVHVFMGFNGDELRERAVP